jgi:hypothetical protein
MPDPLTSKASYENPTEFRPKFGATLMRGKSYGEAFRCQVERRLSNFL